MPAVPTQPSATSMTEHWALWCGAPWAVPDPRPTSPAAQTRFVEEPEDQTVVAGQRIVLSCVVLNYSGIVQWTKDGLALGMGQGLKGTRGRLRGCHRVGGSWALRPLRCRCPRFPAPCAGAGPRVPE